MNLNINSNNLKRFGLWLLAAIYTYLLQYMIIIWNVLNEKIGISSAKKISPLIILFICIVFMVLFIQQKKSFRDHFAEIFTIFSAILFVFLYQPQQQKLSHVPEYMLLSFIVYATLRIDFEGHHILPLTFIITTYLGLIDELLQGINPLRHYGSEDMLVNSLSALAGVCIISIFKNHRIPDSQEDHFSIFLVLSTFTVLMLTVLSTVNIVALFDEAARQTRFQDFPEYLFIIDIFSLVIGIIFLLCIYSYNRLFPADTIVPVSSITAALVTLIGIVVFCNFYSVKFL